MKEVIIFGLGVGFGYWLKARNSRMRELERENSYFRDKCENRDKKEDK